MPFGKTFAPITVRSRFPGLGNTDNNNNYYYYRAGFYDVWWWTSRTGAKRTPEGCRSIGQQSAWPVRQSHYNNNNIKRSTHIYTTILLHYYCISPEAVFEYSRRTIESMSRPPVTAPRTNTAQKTARSILYTIIIAMYSGHHYYFCNNVCREIRSEKPSWSNCYRCQTWENIT